MGVLCIVGLPDQCCCFIGKGPEGRSYTNWELGQRIGLKFTIVCVLPSLLEDMDEAIWGLYKSKTVFIVKTPIVGDKSKIKSNWYKARREILVSRTDQSRDRTDTGLSTVSNDVTRTQLLFSYDPDETPAQKFQANV